jgi:hypothetical protein
MSMPPHQVASVGLSGGDKRIGRFFFADAQKVLLKFGGYDIIRYFCSKNRKWQTFRKSSF